MSASRQHGLGPKCVFLIESAWMPPQQTVTRRIGGGREVIGQIAPSGVGGGLPLSQFNEIGLVALTLDQDATAFSQSRSTQMNVKWE